MSSTGANVDTISQTVVARHLNRGKDRLRPLTTRPRCIDNQTDGLLGEVEASMTAVLPRTILRRGYRRPNLPNLFGPDRWNGKQTSVLYLVPSFGVGGAEAFDLRTISCLPKERYSVILVACEQPDGPWYEEFLKAKVDGIYSLERMGVDRKESGVLHSIPHDK